jgi:hypothetical protein
MAKLRSQTQEGFDLTNMCTPATLYFFLSIIGMVLVGLSNLDSPDQLCIGDYSCDVGNNTVVFVLNGIYILFWTFILDLMCKNGYGSLSWFVFLLPFLITFIFLATIMIRNN